MNLVLSQHGGCSLCICWKQSVLIGARIPIRCICIHWQLPVQYYAEIRHNIPTFDIHFVHLIIPKQNLQCFFQVPATWLLPHCTLLFSFIGHRLFSYEMPQNFGFEVDCSRPPFTVFIHWNLMHTDCYVLENIPINKQIYTSAYNWARHIC